LPRRDHHGICQQARLGRTAAHILKFIASVMCL
jgi:hypothetical protein